MGCFRQRHAHGICKAFPGGVMIFRKVLSDWTVPYCIYPIATAVVGGCVCRKSTDIIELRGNGCSR